MPKKVHYVMKKLVQSMVNGEAGDPTAHAVPLVTKELTLGQEPAFHQCMEEKIVLEITKKERLAIQMSNVQSMANGEAGDLTDRKSVV